MNKLSLQQKIDQHESALNMLKTSQAGRYPFPIASEFTNWADEQFAWRDTVAFMDQSVHMTDLYVEGPDVIPFLQSLAINGFKKFGNNKAKQIVCCAPNGYIIGDMILFGLSDTLVNVVGRPTVANWVEYNATLGNFDVTTKRDERKLDGSKPRETFRYEVQGPRAWSVLEKIHGSKLTPAGFFKMGEITVNQKSFRTLQHGMGSAPGLELWGPSELGEEIKATILAAGEEFDMKQVGARAYGSAAVDSGWWASVFPAIYTGDELKAYREWLPAATLDGVASIGGSFESDNIDDYCFTPWELDYGRLIRFDHDFVGRAALEQLQHEKHRQKVSLVFNPEDVAAVYSSLMQPGQNGKYMEMPSGHYSSYPTDAVLDSKDNVIGISSISAFLAPGNSWVSLATVDKEFAEPGTEVTLVWGEPNGGSHRPPVERHKQMNIRCTVVGWPYSELAKSSDYRSA